MSRHQKRYEVSLDQDERPPSPLASPYVGSARHHRHLGPLQQRLNAPPVDEATALLGAQMDHPIAPPTPVVRPTGDVELGVTFASDVEDGDDDDDMTDDAKDSKDGDDEEDDDKRTIDTAGGVISAVIETIGDTAETAWGAMEDIAEEARTEMMETSHYDWREFWRGGTWSSFVRWLLTGTAPNAKQTDDEIQENLNSLARLLGMLREYHDRFGMPTTGGGKDDEFVLREITKDLYAGGAPLWTLEPVMKKVAEGLTGKRGVDFFILPRRAFIFAPSSGATSMFRIDRGYSMQKLDAMEKVAVRLASFASNTSTVSNMPSRWPKPQELRQAYRTESLEGYCMSQEEMVDEILALASDAEGLFFYINSRQYQQVAAREERNKKDDSAEMSALDEFWTVEESTRELFSRLASTEAIQNIEKLDKERTELYSREMVTFFRFASSAGACAFWFNGSWGDILVSGSLAVFVAWIGASPVLSKQERIIFEAVASFLVGLISALIALHWPHKFCFGALAISGVLDLLQGFRVVYSIIEIMSRHTVTGGADFFEGVFFTTLIAYFLRFGQYAAVHIHGAPEDNSYNTCDKGVNEWWYLLFVPLAAVAWSGLFNPNYYDLPFMAAHGVVGYVVSWQFYKASPTSSINNFLAAVAVTFCAGIVSRFTGRQALGNTVAGLYVLLPGAYLVSEVYKNQIEGFLMNIILRAVIIGLGAWTGTILCSPTLLGTNRGLLNQAAAAGMQNGSMHGGAAASSFVSTSSIGSAGPRRRDYGVRRQGTGALLFF